MGRYLSYDDIRRGFAKPLSDLSAEFDGLCKRWEEAHDSGQIVRKDLLLNEVTPQAALGVLRKFLRETSGKLDDAIAGVYRYRDAERRRAGKKRQQGNSQG